MSEFGQFQFVEDKAETAETGKSNQTYRNHNYNLLRGQSPRRVRLEKEIPTGNSAGLEIRRQMMD